MTNRLAGLVEQEKFPLNGKYTLFLDKEWKNANAAELLEQEQRAMLPHDKECVYLRSRKDAIMELDVHDFVYRTDFNRATVISLTVLVVNNRNITYNPISATAWKEADETDLRKLEEAGL